MRSVLLAALFAVALVAATGILAFQRRECEGTPPNRLIVRERGRVSDDDPSPLNVREGPSTNFDPPIGQIPVGGIFYVLEGPECSPRYAWYRVEYREENGDFLIGWIAEGETDLYFVETYPPGE
jgi:hypothetical protein